MKPFANKYGYSDIEPYEVVRVISDKTLEIRRMESKPKNWVPEIIPGGFSGHCKNNLDQQWEITSDVEEPTIRIRWSKAKQVWQSKGGCKFRLGDEPVKFFDYNF